MSPGTDHHIIISLFEVAMKKMKGNNGYLVVIFLQVVMSWVCVTSSSRPFAPHEHAAAAAAAYSAHVHLPPGAGAGSNQNDQTLEINLSTKEVNNMTSSSSINVRIKNEAATAAATSSMKGEVEGLVVVVRIGSSPPNCEHKCYGCIPCEPTQEPTTHAHALQYANYEPEGWKCKCGPSFYTP